MAHHWLSVLLLLALATVPEFIAGRRNAGMPDGFPGGIRRVIKLNRDTFVPALSANPFLFVFFQYVTDQAYAHAQEQQMEVAAASLQGQNVKFALVNMHENKLLGKELGLAPVDTVMIYRKDTMPQEYFGQRSANYIVPYVMEMLSTPSVKIEGKQQKKQFEQYEHAKVIAYLEPSSKMAKMYRKVGMHFHPIVPFYEVYDKKLAKNLRLKRLNTIHFVKPHEKFIEVPSEIADEKSLMKYIYQNRRQTLSKLRIQDIHLTWGHMYSANMFTAFIKPKTPSGIRFFSLLKSVCQHYRDNKTLHFVWVDVEEFPELLTQWKMAYGIDTQQPFAFGYISLAKNQHAWFDSTAQEPTVKNIRQWVDVALSGQLELKNTTIPRAQEREKEATLTPDVEEKDDEEGVSGQHTDL